MPMLQPWPAPTATPRTNDDDSPDDIIEDGVSYTQIAAKGGRFWPAIAPHPTATGRPLTANVPFLDEASVVIIAGIDRNNNDGAFNVPSSSKSCGGASLGVRRHNFGRTGDLRTLGDTIVCVSRGPATLVAAWSRVLSPQEGAQLDSHLLTTIVGCSPALNGLGRSPGASTLVALPHEGVMLSSAGAERAATFPYVSGGDGVGCCVGGVCVGCGSLSVTGSGVCGICCDNCGHKHGEEHNHDQQRNRGQSKCSSQPFLRTRQTMPSNHRATRERLVVPPRRWRPSGVGGRRYRNCCIPTLKGNYWSQRRIPVEGH